jgi:hypothetical protein
MEKASKFDEQESLTVPANQVLAIMTDLPEAKELVQILNRNDFLRMRSVFWPG